MSTTTVVTLAEFEALANGPEQFELLKAEIVRLPPPVLSHMDSVERLYEALKAAVEEMRRSNPKVSLGRVHVEMGYLLTGDPPSWIRPDVSLTHCDQPADRYYLGAPMLLFEIVSEHDRARDLQIKVAEALRHGAKEVWLIYPEDRTAVIHRPDDVARETRAIHSALLGPIEIPFEQFL